MSAGTLGELLGRCLRAAGATRVFGSPDSGLIGIPGLIPARVDEPVLATLLADAAGRLGRGPGVALLPDRVVHLGSQPGATADRMVLGDPEHLPGAIAGWSLGAVHAAVDLVFDFDLDAPVPDGLEPLVLDESPEILTLSPDLAEFRTLAVAGPGVVRAGHVDALATFAADAGCGVLNTWGAKGVFGWDDPAHLGTVGLQANDFDLAGLMDVELVIAVGIDPAELPVPTWHSGQVLEVEPHQLVALAYRWPPPEGQPERPVLYRHLAEVINRGIEAETVPLNPARAVRDLASALPPGGLVAADPGQEGLWVARAFPTREPTSVVVPGLMVHGFAAAAAIVAALDGRPAIAVTAEPADLVTDVLVELAASWEQSLVLEVWGADVSVGSAEAHAEALRAALPEPGVHRLAVPVDFAETRSLIEVAGPVVAWTDPSQETQSQETL